MARTVSRQTNNLPTAARSASPVVWWAWVGGVLLALEIWFIAKWIFSDQFVPVPSGPDIPPEWMRMTLDIGQVFFTLAWCLSFYWFVIRPWLRERRLTTDSFILLGCTLVGVWDSLSDVGQYWFTYNSYLINRGSILGVLPITLSPHAAGANEALPLFIPMVYGNNLMVAIFMCAVLRFVQRKWSQVGTPTLVAVCFVLGVIVDIVFEAVILLPLGFWTYAGGHWSINADTYYKFPLHEAILVGALWAALGCVRFFVDDKGQTLFERGLDKVTASPLQKGVMRATAVMGGVITIYIVIYHLPTGLLALHSTEWPDDVKNRSYFTNRICGPQVNLACPGPNTPIPRPGTLRPDFSGHYPQQGDETPH